MAEYKYDAWGNIISETGTIADKSPYRYAGYRYDDETGLYYLMTRYYDADLGRFISRDAVQHINLYAYSANNPVMFVDPSGNIVETIFDAASLTASTLAFIGDPNILNATFLAWDIAATFTPSHWVLCRQRCKIYR